MAAFRLSLFCVLCSLPYFIECLPEPGKMTLKFSPKHEFGLFPKSLYKGAVISVKGRCTSKLDTPPKIKIEWKLKYSECGGKFISVKEETYGAIWDSVRNHEIIGGNVVDCKSHITLKDFSSAKEFIVPTNSTLISTTPAKVKKNKQSDKPLKPTTKAAVDVAKKKKTKKASLLKKKKAQDEEKVRQKREPGLEVKREPGLEEMLHSLQRREISEEVSNIELVRVKRRATLPEDNKKGDSNDQEDDTEGNDVDTKASETSKPKQLAKLAKPVEESPKKEQDEGSQKANPGTKKEEQPTPQKVKKNPQKKQQNTNQVASARRDGTYLFIAKVDALNKGDEFHLELEVSMKSDSGFLSALDWPLLPFYGVMSLVYLFYGIVWLIVSACQWRDLLRIQFWIGGVIALGMLEKAVFYSEYNNVNNTGVPTPSLVVFAELVSVLKRTLARMLVIIVSMGFGIVKPRLGSSLHRVLGVGALYFILGIVEGSFRTLSHKADASNQQMIASVPLAVLDAAICWWIFMSLVQTTRTLRIRRNVVKLSLYRHFTNTLIFAVLASVAYMIWSIKTHKFADCIKDWSELWLDEAFWHFLFSIILLVIMVLWRPTANNQRYAFTPLVDFGDDEDEDNMTLSEAFEGMKNRNNLKSTSSEGNGDPRKKADDDLKWVEENIPSSAADTVLPSVLDSDEELMTTKFEMSKME